MAKQLKQVLYMLLMLLLVAPVIPQVVSAQEVSSISPVAENAYTSSCRLGFEANEAEHAKIAFVKNSNVPLTQVEARFFSEEDKEIFASILPVISSKLVLRKHVPVVVLQQTRAVIFSTPFPVSAVATLPNHVLFSQPLNIQPLVEQQDVDALVPNPVLTGITAVFGAGTHAQQVIANFSVGYQVMLSGTNLGNTPGFVLIDPPSPSFSLSVVGSAWRNEQVTLILKSNAVAAVPGNITFRLVTADQRSSQSITIGVCPSISGRQWGSAPWWTARRRIELGKTVSPSPYYSNFVATPNTTNLQRGDVGLAGTVHQYIVEQIQAGTVIRYSNGSIDTPYTITVSECNIQFFEAVNTFTYKVVLRKQVNGSIVFVSGYPGTSSYWHSFYNSPTSNIFR